MYKPKTLPNSYVYPGMAITIKTIDPVVLYLPIIAFIGNLYNLDMNELSAKGKRGDELVYVKHLIYYIIKDFFPNKLYPNITLKLLGSISKADHTSVIHGLKVFKNRLDTNATLPSKLKTKHNYKTTIEDYSFTKNHLITWIIENKLTL